MTDNNRLTDLVARLRAFAIVSKRDEFTDAADLIERLVEDNARIAVLEAALKSVLTGGNHLALLIGADHPLHTASHEEAMAHYGAGDSYEIWCCWRTMMQAGPVLAARAVLEGEDD